MVNKLLLISLLSLTLALTGSLGAKDYTRQQKIWQGIIKEPVYTTCRLKKIAHYKNGIACIYIGSQKTYEIEFTNTRIGCPKSYKCILKPNGTEPSIDDVMKSLRDIAK